MSSHLDLLNLTRVLRSPFFRAQVRLWGQSARPCVGSFKNPTSGVGPTGSVGSRDPGYTGGTSRAVADLSGPFCQALFRAGRHAPTILGRSLHLKT